MGPDRVNVARGFSSATTMAEKLNGGPMPRAHISLFANDPGFL